MENEFEKGFMAGYLINFSSNSDSDSGSSGLSTWSYPGNWLKLPVVKPNQVAILFENRGWSGGGTIGLPDYKGDIHLTGLNYKTYNATIDYRISNNEKTYIDWGDGNKYYGNENEAHHGYHTYTPGTGTNVGSDSEQFIVIINFDPDATRETDWFAKVNYRSDMGLGMNALAIRIGDCKYMNSTIYLNNGNIQHLKIDRGQLESSCYEGHQLRKVELGDSITSLPQQAFINSYVLTDINTDNITSIGMGAFMNNYNLDVNGLNFSKVTTIGNYAFQRTGSSELNLDLLKNVETIGDYVFSYCTKLKKVSCSEIESIPAYMFNGCDNLVSADLQNVTTISNGALSYCTRLNTLNAPSLETLGNYAFYNDYTLQKVTLPKNFDLEESKYAFQYAPQVKFEYV